MNRTTLLLLLLGLALPLTAVAGPGDAAPDMGDDDDDDDDDNEDDAFGPGRDRAPLLPADDEDEPEAEEPEAEEPTEDEAEEPDFDDEADQPDVDEDEEDEEADEPEADEPEADEPEPETEADLDDRYRIDSPAAEEPAKKEKEAAPVAPEERKRKNLVKVIQKKFFLKYRRLEITPMVGYMGTDDFIQRIGFGAAVGFHLNDLFSFEVLASYLPNFKDFDYKPLTNRLRNRDEVVPDISRLMFLGVFNMAISPIYGKVELGTLRIINYDIYLTAGAGIASTADDVDIIQNETCMGLSRRDSKATAGCQYVFQEHLVTNLGGGFRIVFNEWIGLRIDTRTFIHIEQTFREGEVGLDMKQNFMGSLGLSLFFPPKARTLGL
jgi:outer membrane beta-barrel protein